MSGSLYFAPISNPVVDLKTGLMRREWYLFFQALFERSGGTIATSADDALLLSGGGATANTADIATLQAAIDAGAQDPVAPFHVKPDVLFAELSGLRDQLAELQKSIDAISQGVLVQ